MQQAAASISAAPAAREDAIWHVVINGEQQGPFVPPQLAEMLTNGTIDWEAFVWAEGFDNWMPLRNVEDLVAQITGSPREAPRDPRHTTTSAGGFGAVSPADAFAGEPSMGADPFADEESPVSAPSQDLFGAGVSVGASAIGPLTGGGASGSPRVSAAQSMMTGARNENSVLFSLKNLQALATGAGDSAPPGALSHDPTGFASGEGSGLIDIRALANATTSGRPDSDNTKDELLSLSNQASGFGTLGSPMMAPPAEETESSGKPVLVASILGGALLVAAAVVAVGVLNRPEPQTAAAVAPVPASATAAAAPTAPAAPAAPAPTAALEPPSEGELAARAAAEAAATADRGPGAGDGVDGPRDRVRAQRRKGGRPGAGAGPLEEKMAPTPATKEPGGDAVASKPNQGGSKSSIDDLLAGALTGPGAGSGKGTGTAAASSANSNLPEKPSRDEVMEAMNGVKGAVSACASGAKGVAFANVTVAGDSGRVTNATIEGQTGTVGSCIARAVRKARFPKFKSATFKVKFPFRL